MLTLSILRHKTFKQYPKKRGREKEKDENRRKKQPCETNKRTPRIIKMQVMGKFDVLSIFLAHIFFSLQCNFEYAFRVFLPSPPPPLYAIYSSMIIIACLMYKKKDFFWMMIIQNEIAQNPT